MHAGFLNSTSSPFDDIPEFTPTSNAIRVNVLWFASLTLSLVSASFSILVKQWLQEYLAGEYASPQARIRIRHFRYPALDDWKVFEIAGILPLLLQTSLALFLVGLCFFTADVHHTLGHTTLPLVAAWGFLILAVSLAPALSPRCPYKTAFLKSTIKRVRNYLAKAVLLCAKRTAVHATPAAKLPNKWHDLLRWDEEEVAKTNTNDIDILIAVDTIQSDDYLFDILLSIILDSMQQSSASTSSERTESLLRILKRRGKQNDGSERSFLDLTCLPGKTMTSVMTMVTSMLKTEVDRQIESASPNSRRVPIELKWEPWMKDCVYLLCSYTTSPIPQASDELFLSMLRCGTTEGKELFELIVSRVPGPDNFSHILDRFTAAITLASRHKLFDILASLMRSYFCPEDRTPNHNHKTLIDIIIGHPEIAPQHISAVSKLVVSLTRSELLYAVDPNTPFSFASWTEHARIFLLRLYKVTRVDSCRTEIRDFIRFISLNRNLSSFLLIPMMATDDTEYQIMEVQARETCITAAAAFDSNGEHDSPLVM